MGKMRIAGKAVLRQGSLRRSRFKEFRVFFNKLPDAIFYEGPAIGHSKPPAPEADAEKKSGTGMEGNIPPQDAHVELANFPEKEGSENEHYLVLYSRAEAFLV